MNKIFDYKIKKIHLWERFLLLFKRPSYVVDNDGHIKCKIGYKHLFGKTRMISGFVGCDNKIVVKGKEVECYFGDLQPRVIDYKENHYELYRKGKVYRWRDNADGGLK